METHPLSEPSSTAPPAAPSVDTLTVWEAKERAGLLALETDEWREKRLLAEDPNTKADVLERIADAVDGQPYHANVTEYYYNEIGLITDALLAHPNTPPIAMLWLLNLITLRSFRSFCCNPVMPFLVLETPDFWERVDEDCCLQLLCEERLPSVVAHTLSRNFTENIAASAQLHIAVTGEIRSQSEGKTALYECGFWQFVVKHHLPTDLGNLRANGTAYQRWRLRLYAAIHLPLSRESFEKSSQVADSDQEQWNRSPLDLMHHLARDGNRLVRWAAQTRLADPDFTFTCHEGNE